MQFIYLMEVFVEFFFRLSSISRKENGGFLGGEEVKFVERYFRDDSEKIKVARLVECLVVQKGFDKVDGILQQFDGVFWGW